MLTNKQIKLLELLDDQILSCKDCRLWTGGSCKPYWTNESKYGLIGDAPRINEVNREPLIGKFGRLLWECMAMFGLKKSDFVILNSVNCNPVIGEYKDAKPRKDECETCFPYIRKYLKIVRPKKTLLLGNFAVGIITGRYNGIEKKSGLVLPKGPFGTDVILSVHPMSCYYNIDNNKRLKRSIGIFNGL